MKIIYILLALMLTSCSYAAPWVYDPTFQKISQTEIAATIRNPKATASEHEMLRARAGTSHLLEYAVSLYDVERKKRPSEPLLQSAFCYAVFVSQMGDYTPTNAAQFEQQKETLWYPASALADRVASGAGAKIPFCLRAEAYKKIMGVGPGGWPQGVKEAEKALALAPNDTYTLRLLAFAHVTNPFGSPDKAIAYARRVVRLIPNSSSGYGYLYRAYSRKKDYVNAFKYLQLSQKRMPVENRNKTTYTTFKILADRQVAAKQKQKP